MEYHYAYYGGRGFRSSLEEAVGAWDENRSELYKHYHPHHQHQGNPEGNTTNAVVVVDYPAFKRKLRKYSQRRTKLKRLLEENDSNGTIPEDAVNSVLYFSEESCSNSNSNNSNGIESKRRMPSSSASSPVDCYLPMVNVGDDCRAELPGIWTKRNQVLYRREILREVSGLEREGVVAFLAEETFRISQVYRSGIQILRHQFLEWRTKIWHERDRAHLPRKQLKRSLQNNNNNNNNESIHDESAGSEDEENPSDTSGPLIRETLLLGKALLDFEAFCVLNILVVRQTLLRYDAFARFVEGTPMMEFYLKSVLRSTTPHRDVPPSQTATTRTRTKKPNLYQHELRQILLHNEIRGLSLEFSRNLDWLCLESEASSDSSVSHEAHSCARSWMDTKTVLETIVHRFRTDLQELRRLVLSSTLDKTVALANETHEEATPTKSEGPTTHTTKRTTTTTTTTAATTCMDKFMAAVAKHFFLGMYMEDQFGWYLDGTHTRGKSLTEEMKSLTDWKRKSDNVWSFLSSGMVMNSGALNPSNDPTCGVGDVFLQGMECDDIAQCGAEEPNGGNKKNEQKEKQCDESNPTTNEISTQQTFNLVMALTAGFLYCMNYYIVEPSSTMYVNALGAHDAAGAALIGMMPIASFLAAIVYSIWTNTVFRQPFLVSCSLMVTGNIVYSSAFNYKSLPMALIGRFLTGLGGPKMIVRRYMADTTSMSIRTSVNAGFGMVVAAGSALGPGCAILLSNFDFTIGLPGFGSELWFNSMTGPGWFMATLWSLFSVALFWGFREQDRIGLAEKLEQEQLEQRQNAEQREEQQQQEEQQQRHNEQKVESNNVQRMEQHAAGATPGSAGGASFVELHPIRKDGFEDSPLPESKTVVPSPASVRWDDATRRPSPTRRSTKYRSSSVSSSRSTAASTAGTITSFAAAAEESSRSVLTAKSSFSMASECYHERLIDDSASLEHGKKPHNKNKNKSLWTEAENVSRHLLFPVRICMGLLFAKVFVIETLVSCTSALSKNRYGWTIHQVGLLGCANGFFVIPLSFFVGKLSLQYQDRYLMVWLLSVGIAGLCLLVDVTDLVDTSEAPQTYNKYLLGSVGPIRYVMGYFVTYLSIQSFEGIIGSALSKLIPTALAQGTFNSGLLATLVDTFGRSCGDLFISLMGFWNIRQLMNLLFLPGVLILATCLVVVRKHYDLLAV